MFSTEDLAADLASRFHARVAVLYGSAARGRARADSDIDVACFAEVPDRYPLAYRWRGLLIDAWIHPMKAAEDTESFLSFHDGRVLIEHEGIGEKLLAAVKAKLAEPPEKLGPEYRAHFNAWVWKMLDRAARGGLEADHRRHWILSELPKVWCSLQERHYLGASHALSQMKASAPSTHEALEHALEPSASLAEIERAVLAIVGPRQASLIA